MLVKASSVLFFALAAVQLRMLKWLYDELEESCVVVLKKANLGMKIRRMFMPMRIMMLEEGEDEEEPVVVMLVVSWWC